MAIFARIENSAIAEIIQPFFGVDGIEVRIEERFPADVVATLRDISDLDPLPLPGWVLKDGSYVEPTPDALPAPTEAELTAAFAAQKALFLSHANEQIAWLQDAVDLGEDEPGDAETLLAWKKYRIALNRLAYSDDAIWPDVPGERQ